MLRAVPEVIVTGFVIGGVLAVAMLLCVGEEFSAGVLAASWVLVIGIVMVLDMAERREREKHE